MPKQPQTKKPQAELDRSDPRFQRIDYLLRKGVINDGRTADDLWKETQAIAKKLGLKNYRKDECHRMHDVYRVGISQAKLRGPFHEAVAKQSIKEEGVRIDLLELASQYVSKASDLRDHISAFDSVAQGNGAAWRVKCREMLERLELSLDGEYTEALNELRDRIELVFDDVVEDLLEQPEQPETD